MTLLKPPTGCMKSLIQRRKICIVTGTRADWGLLSPVARALSERSDVELQIVATNMHLDPRYGMTVDEITGDGFAVDECVAMTADDDSHFAVARSAARCLDGMAAAFDRLRPDLLLILGDRYEMLAVATAATIMRIPIAHIAGGEISEGAIDDNIRHAITKLSSLHLTATEPYRRRVIAMGEDPSRVINAGAIGVYGIEATATASREELEEFTGLDFSREVLLVTLHPATLDDTPVGERTDALLSALDAFPAIQLLITYPNNDPAGRVIIEKINDYASRNPDRVSVVPSLGHRRYLSALKYVSAVVGNSSSGIVEVPSFHIPTVDIGIRQRGRIASRSVVHCEADASSIERAVAFALSAEGKELARNAQNPYSKSDTLSLIVEAVATTPLESLRTKRFYDSPLSFG